MKLKYLDQNCMAFLNLKSIFSRFALFFGLFVPLFTFVNSSSAQQLVQSDSELNNAKVNYWSTYMYKSSEKQIYGRIKIEDRPAVYAQLFFELNLMDKKEFLYYNSAGFKNIVEGLFQKGQTEQVDNLIYIADVQTPASIFFTWPNGLGTLADSLVLLSSAELLKYLFEKGHLSIWMLSSWVLDHMKQYVLLNSKITEDGPELRELYWKQLVTNGFIDDDDDDDGEPSANLENLREGYNFFGQCQLNPLLHENFFQQVNTEVIRVLKRDHLSDVAGIHTLWFSGPQNCSAMIAVHYTFNKNEVHFNFFSEMVHKLPREKISSLTFDEFHEKFVKNL